MITTTSRSFSDDYGSSTRGLFIALPCDHRDYCHFGLISHGVSRLSGSCTVKLSSGWRKLPFVSRSPLPVTG